MEVPFGESRSLARRTRVLVLFLVGFGLWAPATSAEPGPRWMILGDSIMTMVKGEGGARDLTASRIPLLTNVLVHNVSRGGGRITTTAWGVIDYFESIEAWLAGPWYTQLDGIVITLGTNDWVAAQTPLGDFLDDYATIVASASSRGIPVVCVSPLPRDGEERLLKPPGQWNGADLATWRRWIHLLCDHYGGHALSGTWLVPEVRPEWMPDGLHLSAEGHAEFTRNLVRWMRFLGYWP